MSKYLCNIPCGTSLPLQNPHAVSVSLPTMNDVIGYEEGEESVLAIMESGYPRFFTNKLVEKLINVIRQEFGIENNAIILPIASIKAKNILEELIQSTLNYVADDENIFLIFKKDDPLLPLCKGLIRNTGLLISSRKAEATLAKKSLLTPFLEQHSNGSDAESEVKSVLANAYGVSNNEILLTNSGMNAVFSACESVSQLKIAEGRDIVIQLGWLYLDTMEIIEKRCRNAHVQININNKAQLENWLLENHHRVGLLMTEAVTNPLIHCVDLPWLSSLCKKYNIILIVDTTIATPFNAELIAYCDIAVESLTKFASGGGDVLMGAIIVNPASPLAQFKDTIANYIIPAFSGDVARLAFQIVNYESRMRKVADNTKALYDYLLRQPYISTIHSVFNPIDADAFSKIRKSDNCTIGVISIIFDKNLAHYYDRLELPKGPTLGTEFTIAMPYVYLAHFDCLQSDEGRKRLQTLGLNPELLRISVGTEPIEDIIAVFEKLKDF